MNKRNLPLAQVYSLLEPGPVVFVVTSAKGKNNVMTMSWYTMLDFEPPLIGCVISNRDYTFSAIKATKECVIAIPTVEMAKKVVGVGNTSGRNTDKIKVFGLTAQPAAKIKPPLILDCYANIECKVVDSSMAGKYNFFVLQALKAWVNPAFKHPKTLHHMGNGVFAVDGKIIKMHSKMK